jgi:general secretion pathway protein B
LVPGAPVAVAALPSDIRNSFPHLKVGGGMYSPQKASRLVVLNDQVWREGDVVMPGLVLLEITPTEVIFSFRAYRVSVKL